MLRRIILPIMALAIAAGTVIYAKKFLDSGNDVASAPAALEKDDNRQVLVAVATVDPGSFLQENTLAWQEWPDVSLPEAYFVDEEVAIGDLTAAVTRHGLSIGEPLTRANVVFPGERGFLAAVLEPGTRAVSVPINETSSNAGLILPGDRVDVILTQALSDPSGGRERWVSETVLEDARVIAMGRRLQPGGQDAPAAAAGDARTATLEVSPEGAELVALVTDLGRLTLSLRSLSAPNGPWSEPKDQAPLADAGTAPNTVANGSDMKILSAKAGRPAPFTRDTDISEILRREDAAQDVLRVVRGPEQQLLELDSEPAR